MQPQKQPNQFVKYSQLGIQMAVTIGLGAWGGMKLDERFKNETPVFTIILSLLGVGAGLYLVLKDFIKPSK